MQTEQILDRDMHYLGLNVTGHMRRANVIIELQSNAYHSGSLFQSVSVYCLLDDQLIG